MHICVIGTGYVGLVTGACLAHSGHSVICIDNDVAKVEQLQSGKSPIYEPGLESIMLSAMAAGKLSFTTDLVARVAHGGILFIAVGTPPLSTGESHTRYVEAVARSIGQHLDARYRVIVNKSTVPIESGGWVRSLVVEALLEHDDAPALDMIDQLLRLGAKVKAYDPLYVDSYPDSIPASVQLCMTPQHLAAGCNALGIAIDWPELKTLDSATLAATMHTPLLINGGNCLDSAVVTQAGLVYVGLSWDVSRPVEGLTVREVKSLVQAA